nr:hypothetical protein CFP56_63496 [Quercus suber]
MPPSCLPYRADEEDREDPDRFVDGSTAGQCLYEQTKHYEELAGAPNRDSYTGPMVKGRSFRDPDLSWTLKSIGRLHETTGNPSAWMNETWGPAIRDTRPPRTREDFLPFPQRPSSRQGHPSATRRPCAQYGGAKEEDKEPASTPKQMKKKLKKLKKHKSSAAHQPSQVEIGQMWAMLASDESADEQSPARAAVGDGVSPATTRDGSARLRCARCKKEDGKPDDCFFLRPYCKKVAYCSGPCEAEDKPGHERFCTGSEQSVAAAQMRAVYPDRKRADGDFVLPASKHPPGLSIINDPRNYITNDDDIMEDVDTTVPSAVQPTVPPIRAFKLFDHRFIEYLVDHGHVQVWRNAEELAGAAWTRQIETFWASEAHLARYRELLDSPDGEHSDLEPGPYGRFVLHGVLQDSRRFLFADAALAGWAARAREMLAFERRLDKVQGFYRMDDTALARRFTKRDSVTGVEGSWRPVPWKKWE